MAQTLRLGTLKNIEDKLKMDKPLNIVMYHCVNLELLQNGGQKTLQRSRPGLRIVTVPCSGKLEAPHLLKTLAGGADAVLVLACEKKACKFFEGSARSEKRMNYAKQWLDELEIDTSRLAFVHATPRDNKQIEGLLDEFVARLKPLAPNRERAKLSNS